MPTELVAADPPERRGATFPLGAELTVGRAGGCAIPSDDTYVSSSTPASSSSTARSWSRTSGRPTARSSTGSKVTAAVPLRRGDRLQVGNTVLEAR